MLLRSAEIQPLSIDLPLSPLPNTLLNTTLLSNSTIKQSNPCLACATGLHLCKSRKKSQVTKSQEKKTQEKIEVSREEVSSEEVSSKDLVPTETRARFPWQPVCVTLAGLSAAKTRARFPWLQETLVALQVGLSAATETRSRLLLAM